jgi:hypothetical protein
MMYAFRCATSKGLDDYMHEISKKDLLGYRFLKSTTMSRSNEALSVRQISSDYDNNIWVSCYNSVFRMKPDFALNTDGEITGQILKNEMNVRKAVFPHRVMNFTIDNKSE